MRYDSASRRTTLLACRRNVARTAVAADGHQIVWAEMTPHGQFVLMRVAY